VKNKKHEENDEMELPLMERLKRRNENAHFPTASVL